MLNRTILIGRLTRDPEMRYTETGIAVTQFTLACDRIVGAGKEKEADFIPIVTWRQLAETCANYLRKGRLCAIEGRIQTRNYENNEARRIYVTEVVADNVRFLESNRDNNQQSGEGISSGSANSNSAGSKQDRRDPFADDGKPIDISEDYLPF